MDRGQFLKDVANNAGAIVREKYHHINSVRTKSVKGDVVTEVDEESERYISSRICAEYPDDGILGEEKGVLSEPLGGTTWIIDPIDGTRNYVIGIPFFCVSIGICEDGVPVEGVIYDPIHDEMFYAKKGGGAWLNDAPIEVIDDGSIEDSVVQVSWVKHRVNGQKFVEYIQNLSHDTSYFRRLGSAALVLAYVACGRLHGYLQGGLSPWDVAAGVILVQEAGGVVTDFAGSPLNMNECDIEIITGNPEIHDTLLNRVVKQA